MLIFMIAVTALLLLTAYVIYRNLTSPLVLLITAFLVSCLIILENYYNWEIQVNPIFVLYCLTAIGAFAAGCFIIDAAKEKRMLLVSHPEKQVINYSRKLPVKSTAIFSAVLVVLYIGLIIKSADFSPGSGNVLRVIYEYVSSGNQSNFFLHQLFEILQAIGKISIFGILVGKYVVKRKISVLELLPLVLLFICIIFSTDRNVFIRFFIYVLVLWIMISCSVSTESVNRTNMMILYKVFLAGIIFIAVFYVLGKIKNYTSNLERMIGIYGGSGLYNFNMFLAKETDIKLRYGAECISSICAVLQRFGVPVSAAFAPAEQKFIIFTAHNGYVYASNIYSSMWPYVLDFGYAGVIIYPLLLGMLFEFLYQRAEANRCGFSWILYAHMIYSVIFFPISEQFFLRLHLGFVYEIFWLWVVYYCIYKDSAVKTRLLSVFRR